MDRYVTGALVKRLREASGMTQQQLAENIDVSAKAVSRWECGRGYPDITLLEPLAAALHVSIAELVAGSNVRNTNKASNMLRAQWYVCPVCGNVVQATGEALISCCGIQLPPLEAEPAEGAHTIRVELVEDELYVALEHPMAKDHHLSFLAAVSPDGIQLAKLYPEGPAAVRFGRSGVKRIDTYCNRHGLFSQILEKVRKPSDAD